MPASPEASKQEESAAAPSTSTAGTSLAAAKTPTLPLPQSVNALTAFVHATQLAHLRERYAYKLRKFARFADDLEKSNARGRRARRRRKLMGNVEGEEESDDGFSSEDDDEPADEERNGESARAAKRLRLTHDDKHPIDPAHAYKLTYDLSPLGSADTYCASPSPVSASALGSHSLCRLWSTPTATTTCRSVNAQGIPQLPQLRPERALASAARRRRWQALGRLLWPA